MSITIHNVEQRSKEWFKMRLGVITGSRAKNMFKANNLSFIDELIAEKLSGEIVESHPTQAMMHGIMMEPIALEEYRMRTGHDTREIGFCVRDDKPWLAISPDALVYDNEGNIRGGLEIKCPSTKKHIEYLRTSRIPAEYKYQILHYFIVIDEIEFMDFMSYDPRIEQSVSLVRVTREDWADKIIMAKEHYSKFYEKLRKYEKQITGE